MLWEVDIYPNPGQPNRIARQVAADAADLGLARNLAVTAAYGYLIQGQLDRGDVNRIADELLAEGLRRFRFATGSGKNLLG